MRPARCRAVVAIGERIRTDLPRDLVAQQIVQSMSTLEAQLLAPLVDDVVDRLLLRRRREWSQTDLCPARVDERHRLRDLALLRECLGLDQIRLDATREAHWTGETRVFRRDPEAHLGIECTAPGVGN